jgi:glycosyltransferase involved in cell wall biosynthesis
MRGPGNRQPTVAILHYSGPPIVGGVENTIYHHSCLLARAGFAVQVIAGRGAVFDPQVAFQVVPELDSRHAEVLAVKAELDQGQVSLHFDDLCARIAAGLRPFLAAVDALIAHNVFTLHKNLPLTAALYTLLVEERCGPARVLAWHHDLAWRRPQYAAEVHRGYPWQLLHEPWPGVEHVTVSEPRRMDVAELYGIPAESVHVVPPGVDAARFLCWTAMTRRIVAACGLLDADMVLLLPARITRRKNIELAIRALACLREQTGLDVRLLVTGPPGPHNPSNIAYLQQLMALRRELGLTQAAHFVYELGRANEPLVPDEPTMASLYVVADALLFPSLEEGFGMPLLEAGLTRLPIFCSNIPPLRATGRTEAYYFDPQAEPAAVADLIAQQLLAGPGFRLRRRIRQESTWERIVQQRVIPLLCVPTKQGSGGLPGCAMCENGVGRDRIIGD